MFSIAGSISLSGQVSDLSNVVIRTRGHNALITDVALVPGKDMALTCSFDKTIKIWNTKEASYEDELLGEIGGEGLGTYSKIKVSPDGKTVAAACIALPMASVNSGTYFGIRIYDIASRKLQSLVMLSREKVEGMDYLDGGEKLAVAYPGWIHILDLKKNIIVDSIDAPAEQSIVETLLFMGRLYFATDNGDLYRYDQSKREHVKVYAFNTEVFALAGNDKRGLLAAATKLGDVVIIDDKFVVHSTTVTDDYPISLAFSPSGENIVVGYYYSLSGSRVYNVRANKLDLKNTLGDQKGLVGATMFYGDSKLITAGGERHTVDFWEMTDTDTGKLLQSCRSNAMPIMAACEYGNALAFSTELTFNESSFPYRWMFGLTSHESRAVIPYGSLLYMLPKPVMQKGKFELSRAGSAEGYVLKILSNGNPFNTLSQLEVASYTFLPNNTIAVGGVKGNLRIFDIYGLEVADLIGHNDAVTSVTIDGMGDNLISSSKDGTIKFWNINKIGYKDDYNTTPASEISDPDFMGKVKEWGLEKEANDKTTPSWYSIITACFVNGQSEWGNQLFTKISMMKKLFLNHVKPEMNVFISNDNEWVIWDKNNYYTGSKGGCRLIGFHINKGTAKEARFYPFEQFDLTNNRPDIIYKFFDPYDTLTIKAYHNAYLKRMKNLGVDPAKVKNNGKVPQLRLWNVSQTVSTPELKLLFSANDSFVLLTKVMVTVNDVPVFGTGGKNIEGLKLKGFNTGLQQDILPPVSLSEGTNRICISVINANGIESLAETFTVQYNNPGLKKPRLYLVAIGVSEYKNKTYNLTYAAKDAGDIASGFGVASARFDSIITMTLTNEKVTKENILKLKQTLLLSRVDDEVIVFLAGHGLLDKNFNFYFATHDIDFAHPELKGISYADIEGLLDGIPSRNKLLMLDACHSGEVDKSSEVDISSLQKPTYAPVPEGLKVTTYLKRGSALLETEEDKGKVGLKNSINLLSEMFYDLRRSSGAAVISAASAEGFALESDRWHNGVFTYAVLNGLNQYNADADNDKSIVVSELKEYILKQVETLTQGKQQPTMRKENPAHDFRVW
jgi:WD40 repeat protein